MEATVEATVEAAVVGVTAGGGAAETASSGEGLLGGGVGSCW